jgi:ATP-dependent Lon protease
MGGLRIDEVSINKDLDNLLTEIFSGRVVRKDLTKMLKEGANVPVFVLEYLPVTYCAYDDEDVINQGMQNVKRILAENYVRPDEAENIKYKIKPPQQYFLRPSVWFERPHSDN